MGYNLIKSSSSRENQNPNLGKKPVEPKPKHETRNPFLSLDQKNINIPTQLPYHAAEIFQQMMMAEKDQVLPKDWIEDNPVKNTRSQMITYFIKISHAFKLSQETLFMTVRLFDKICHIDRKSNANKFVFFIACIHMCCKYEESRYYKIDNFLDMFSSDLKKIQVIMAEEKILKLVNFKVGTHTPYDFLKRIC
jgi:hypothetical protein